ncbi:expressed protein [Echinococcus multilocularis]|uniref:Expressed protein n=1 Tax=Echinococcus multilocularis TaxID=6211 RepID=A0A068XX26_ECHMU|nr:expressed protein [Echinococcus multilocularis]
MPHIATSNVRQQHDNQECNSLKVINHPVNTQPAASRYVALMHYTNSRNTFKFSVTLTSKKGSTGGTPMSIRSHKTNHDRALNFLLPTQIPQIFAQKALAEYPCANATYFPSSPSSSTTI